MAPASAERRRERRYIVVGVRASVDGEACPIVDMSATAVRLLRPRGLAVRKRPYTVAFTIGGATEPGTFTVSATLVRSTDTQFVLRYRPPVPDWEALIRSMDTLEQTKLSELFV
jgi:hypothetical protein